MDTAIKVTLKPLHPAMPPEKEKLSFSKFKPNIGKFFDLLVE